MQRNCRIAIKLQYLLLVLLFASSFNMMGQQDFIITVLGDELEGGITMPNEWSEYIFFGEQRGDTTSRVTPQSAFFFIHKGKRYETHILDVRFNKDLLRQHMFVRIESHGSLNLFAGSSDRYWVNDGTTSQLMDANRKGELTDASKDFLYESMKDCALMASYIKSAKANYSSLKSLLDRYAKCSKNPLDPEAMPEEIDDRVIVGKTFDDLGEWWFGAEFGVQYAQFNHSSDVRLRHNFEIKDGASPQFGVQAMYRLSDGDLDVLIRGALSVQAFDFERTVGVKPEADEIEPIHTFNYNPLFVNFRAGVRLSGSSLFTKGYIELGPSINFQNSFDFIDRYVYKEGFETITEFTIAESQVNDIQTGVYLKGGVMLNRAEAFATGQYYPELIDFSDSKENIWMVGVGLSYWIF